MRNPRGTQIATSLTNPKAGLGYSDSFADKLRRFRIDANLDIEEALTLLEETGVSLAPDDLVVVATLLAGVSQRAYVRSRRFAGYTTRRQAEQPSVYFIRSGEFVKIGTTQWSVQDRVASMQLPPGAEVVAVIPGASHTEETELHRRFAASRVAGEWFTASPELNGLIETFRVS